MRIIRNILFSILFIFIVSSPLSSDSFTFSTSINSVTSGINDFGMGLLPIGTSFTYYKNVEMIKGYKHKARINLQSDFSFSERSVETNYDYNTGTPKWYLTPSEHSQYDFLPVLKDVDGSWGRYFNPRASFDFYLQQSFGTNPYQKSGALTTVRVGFNTKYSIALERVLRSADGKGFTFVNDDGSEKAPFGKDAYFPAIPWLSGNREGWNNYLYLNTYWYLRKSRGIDESYDGIYGEVCFEYGPWWLGNNILPTNGISSDYWKVYGSLKEYLTLANVKQDNNWNWFSLVLAHNNTLGYIGGDIIPEQKIPTDRFRCYFTDQIYLKFYFPQFVASDSWAYLQLSLNNNLYFGNVVNERSQETEAIELQSSVSGTFMLRLFGFMRFQYSLSYTFFRGVHASNPYWSQGAELRFFISV